MIIKTLGWMAAIAAIFTGVSFLQSVMPEWAIHTVSIGLFVAVAISLARHSK